jgi:PiT family inorganic phosphate transporter
MTFLIIIIIAALVFDYINGFHDSANSIATIVSTKVLTPFQAVVWAAMFNFIAFFIFKDHAVANTIGKTVNIEFITLPVIFSGLLAAIFWNLLTWYYGIPSSSSHTLIGGFAGAAIAHAFATKGMMPLDQIVDSQKILKTITFIFLAPLIGMTVAMFIATITMIPNTYFRIAAIAVTTVGTWFFFDYLQDSKMKENLKMYYKIDKYEKEIVGFDKLLKTNSSDTVVLKKKKDVLAKIEKANKSIGEIEVYLPEYKQIKGEGIAAKALANGTLKDIAISKLKDEIGKTNGLGTLEVEGRKSPEKKKEYTNAKEQTEKYKEPLKKLATAGLDSTIAALNAIYPIKDKEAVAATIKKFNIETSLASVINKADNSFIRYGILFLVLCFCVSYMYTERIAKAGARQTANMFKRLQLLSSAAFSIGHGGNDAQKVMGIIGAAFVAYNYQQYPDIQSALKELTWVPLACYAAIGLGTLSGGWKIVKTMGSKITKVTPIEGVSAETAGAMTLFMTEQMGIPVSTTHTITGAIIGVGVSKSLSAVKWGVTFSIVWAWILTIPVSAVLAAICYKIVSMFV